MSVLEDLTQTVTVKTMSRLRLQPFRPGLEPVYCCHYLRVLLSCGRDCVLANDEVEWGIRDVREAVEDFHGSAGVFKLHAETFVALAHSRKIRVLVGWVRSGPPHFLGAFTVNPARFDDRNLHRQREMLAKSSNGSAQLPAHLDIPGRVEFFSKRLSHAFDSYHQTRLTNAHELET